MKRTIRPITILILGILFGQLIKIAIKKQPEKPFVPLKVKAKGYTLFEKGRGIDENGDTIIVKPIFR
jgi:hypothetical protein